MNGTLKMLLTIVRDEDKQKTMEQLSQEYQQNLNPCILAITFDKVFNLINSISENYYGLSSADVASYALDELDYCLLNYEESKAKFTTFYTTILKNRLRHETQKLNAQKRKTIFYTTTFDNLAEDVLKTDIEYDFMINLKSYRLTEKEQEYCRLLSEGWTNSDIAKKFGVTSMALSHMRKKLRIKFAGYTL